MKKKLFIYSLFLLLIIFTYDQNIFGIKYSLKKSVLKKYPNLHLELRTNLFKEKSIIENLTNDYNVKFLPETQFLDLNLDRKKIIFNDDFNNNNQTNWMYNIFKDVPVINVSPFYLDEYQNKIILVGYLGDIYHLNKEELLDTKTNFIKPKNIISNLSPYKVLDVKIHNKKIYISYIKKQKDCLNLNISVADLNFDSLNFSIFFTSKDCGAWIQAGRIVTYKHNDIEGLLFSTSNQIRDDTDREINPPQDDNSIFGKILFFNIETKKYINFSKGHRNIQGLYAQDDLILSTEHGPRGGDEINRIIFKKNYGWPIASYGEKYDAVDNSKTYYKKNHFSLGFEEPIFAFVPSIGISEIIKLPNKFSDNFKDNFIVSTLTDLHLYRVKFDANYNKIVFYEKIFIGDRIRDLKYIDELDIILLALEIKGELGILRKIKN